ncbi:hypothetical protein B0187_08460 [Haemophilus paracuniculus]|uniref:Uncharacterized protein n=1 Tax=Haemophilus paracuniculus TaxID=734 RepID=A0A1T0AQY4_9PAST|nr:NirD/YgiW/YdeI family stress tolerance protein [Haemophilus paracuniculus]OOR98467.1 hypothetical protein B0187_08460 [Haemophilus paracuniculus]
MKKLLLTSVLALALSAPAMAGFQNGNASNGKSVASQSATISKVAQAKKARDNARFVISGNIINQLGDDEFTFKDETGTIRIDVDDRAWRGLNVSPKDRIRISGKVDVDSDTGERTLEVNKITR